MLVLASNTEMIDHLQQETHLPTDIPLPVLVISKHAGMVLRKFAEERAGAEGEGARIRVRVDNSVYHHWKEIRTLWRSSNWPRRKNSRFRLLQQMLKLHSSKYASGSEDRHRALQAAYENAMDL